MTGPGHVPFNRAYSAGEEASAVQEAIEAGHLSADGPFSESCVQWLQDWSGSARVLLMPSCTAALETAALLAELGPGDEVIMPSYTFPSTANAVVLRGATPVFVDIRPDTLNLDEALIEDALTSSTRAILPVHYAGVGCEMGPILELAGDRGLSVIEDAAQGILASRGGRPLGSMGALGAISFHETKAVTSGEGGALLVNDESLVERAEIIRDKGTNRRQFFEGTVDKYTWVDLGSSYGMSDLNAAFLWVQLRAAAEITRMRLELWDRYQDAFAELEQRELVRRPVSPDGCEHNAHLYYLLLPSPEARAAFLRELRSAGVDAVFHYVPLHSAPAGTRFSRAHGELSVTDRVSSTVVRLPLWAGMEDAQQERVITVATEALSGAAARA
jgi:dTDP-4-amino-4,6-dideoxygalactose transaminase